MKILSPDEFASRLDFVRPMEPQPKQERSLWSVPFEYGANEKGTRISVMKARQIIAELQAAVAIVEAEELREAFEDEKNRVKSLCETIAKKDNAWIDAQKEIAKLKAAKRKKR